MKQFRVLVKEILTQAVDIDAEDETEAYNIAYEMYEKEKIKFDLTNFSDYEIEVG